MTPPAPKPSVGVIEELRSLYAKATPGRSVRLLSLTGGMAGECLLEFGDPTNGGRSIQIRKADALLDEAMHRHLPALLAVVEAAKEAARYTGTTASGTGAAARAYKKLDEALSALDATGGGHG